MHVEDRHKNNLLLQDHGDGSLRLWLIDATGRLAAGLDQFAGLKTRPPAPLYVWGDRRLPLDAVEHTAMDTAQGMRTLSSGDGVGDLAEMALNAAGLRSDTTLTGLRDALRTRLESAEILVEGFMSQIRRAP